MREYIAVVTRPVEVNGFGLNAADAVSNVREFLDDMVLLPEDLSIHVENLPES